MNPFRPNPDIRQRTLEALSLRRFALALFGAAPAEEVDAALAAALDASPAAWSVFLRVERCGLPLHTRLARMSLLEHVPTAAREVLTRFARGEMQRVVSARAHLQMLAKQAAAAGWNVVVLKGAVAAVDDEWMLDLSDVDVLLSPSDGVELAAWLDARGFSAKPRGTGHHLPARTAMHVLPIEVHHRLKHLGDVEDWVRQAVPLAGSAPLMRLAPPDHLRSILVHAVRQHPERRGRLRELIQMRQASLASTLIERRGVQVWIDEMDDRVPLGTTWTFLGEFAGDPYVRVAAGNYIEAERRRRILLPPRVALRSARARGALLEGSAAWQDYWGGLKPSRLDHESGLPWLDPLAACSAAAARGARRLMTAAALAGGAALAWPAAREATRATEGSCNQKE